MASSSIHFLVQSFFFFMTSKSIMPHAKKSHLSSPALHENWIGKYPGVPKIVSFLWSVIGVALLKSIRTTLKGSRVMTTFSGLRSRWIQPEQWSYERPSNTSLRMAMGDTLVGLTLIVCKRIWVAGHLKSYIVVSSLKLLQLADVGHVLVPSCFENHVLIVYF